MSNESKARVIEVNRRQHVLRPTDVESLIPDDHPARAIWEFVGRMDLKRFYASIASVEGEAGRTAWDPRLMIAIWIYAYSRGIGSAREIERRCEYDPAFQWLTGMEVVNHHTLSDFRMSGKATLDELFKQVLGLLSTDGLIGLERVMHDGTKIRAKASGDTFRREDKIREYLKLAEEQIKAMGDPRKEDLTRRAEKAQERSKRERKEKLDLALLELEKIREAKIGKEAKAEARASVTDPEARIMKQGNGGYAACYNAQISTDSKHGIIVGAAVTQNGSDYKELLPALKTIEKINGKLPDQIVVDGGFTSRENIIGVAEKKVDLIGSVDDGHAQIQAYQQLNRRGVTENFYPNKFIYDSASNTYQCPEGNVLVHKGEEKTPGRVNHLYKADSETCLKCPSKQFCCPRNKIGRSLVIGSENPVVTAFKAKMETDFAREIYKTRGPIAEFSNAWIKTKIGLRQFCVQGHQKVSLELQWACLTLNIQHWIRLKWIT